MPLRGKGMLIVFRSEIAHERDFNEWYNREHIDERLNLPGFQRARRWVAVNGSPKYLATYECDRVGDLATPHYLALLANQTPWTQTMMARFTKFNRMTLRVQVDLTHGLGGALAAVRFVPDPRERKPDRLAARHRLARGHQAARHAGRGGWRERHRRRQCAVGSQEHGQSQGRRTRMGGVPRSGRRRCRGRRARDLHVAALRISRVRGADHRHLPLLFGNQR